MQGLRLTICDSCISSRGSLASTVTAGEVAEAQAPKLRQQLELQIRRGRNCQTTGGRIVRKHCKYRGTSRCCQEGLNTTKTWSATSSKHQKQRCQLYRTSPTTQQRATPTKDSFTTSWPHRTTASHRAGCKKLHKTDTPTKDPTET